MMKSSTYETLIFYFCLCCCSILWIQALQELKGKRAQAWWEEETSTAEKEEVNLTVWPWRAKRKNWKWTSYSALLVTGITYNVTYNCTEMTGRIMETNACSALESTVAVIVIWAVRNVITKTVGKVF